MRQRKRPPAQWSTARRAPQPGQRNHGREPLLGVEGPVERDALADLLPLATWQAGL
jgi:hypothetical protein